MIAPDSKILVINIARIGDTLLLTPALKAIKSACPGGKLHVAGHPGRVGILKNLPFIDRLQRLTKKSAPWRGRLNFRKSFDLAFVYGNDATLARYALRVAEKVVAFRQNDESLNRRLSVVEKPTATIHAVQERLLLLRAAGIKAEDLTLSYKVAPQEAAAAEIWWAGHFTAHEGPIIGLQLASFPTKAYRDWPLSHFQALIGKICSRYPAARFVALGDKDSKDRADRLRRAFPGKMIIAAGAFTLRQSAAVMARLDLYIGVDTGPTHLAGALGIPMVALYHCFHRGQHLAPLSHPALRIVEHPRTDQQCGRETSMEEITVDMAWIQVNDLLSRTYGSGDAGSPNSVPDTGKEHAG